MRSLRFWNGFKWAVEQVGIAEKTIIYRDISPIRTKKLSFGSTEK
jgi:hypothetical protein